MSDSRSYGIDDLIAENRRMAARITELESEKPQLERLAYERWEIANSRIKELEMERNDYRQAAQVEAGLRREFLTRAEKAETERDVLQARVDELQGTMQLDGRFTVNRVKDETIEQCEKAIENVRDQGWNTAEGVFEDVIAAIHALKSSE